MIISRNKEGSKSWRSLKSKFANNTCSWYIKLSSFYIETWSAAHVRIPYLKGIIKKSCWRKLFRKHIAPRFLMPIWHVTPLSLDCGSNCHSVTKSCRGYCWLFVPSLKEWWLFRRKSSNVWRLLGQKLHKVKSKYNLILWPFLFYILVVPKI